jgi:hypothetical protein
MRSIRVRNFVEVPVLMLVVNRAEPEGVRVNTIKSDRSRRVPIVDRVLALIRACAEGRGPDERLFMTDRDTDWTPPRSTDPELGQDVGEPADSRPPAHGGMPSVPGDGSLGHRLLHFRMQHQIGPRSTQSGKRPSRSSQRSANGHRVSR